MTPDWHQTTHWIILSDRLLERLIQRIRKRTAPAQPAAPDVRLAAMAQDPNLQRELKLIEEEFAYTEADGLGVAE